MGFQHQGGCKGDAPTPAKTPTPKTKPKKEETRRCRLCRRQKCVADWPVNCPNCRDCKQALDNLARSALKQDQMDWWKETRADETKLRKVVERYQQDCPKQVLAKTRKQFNLTKYIEVHEAASGIVSDNVGVMMHRSRFLSFAQTHEHPKGKLSQNEAETKWEEMANEAKLGQRIRDQNGPESEPLRLRVECDTKISFRNQYMQAKRQEVQYQREQKEASTESIQAGRRAMLRDHESNSGLNRDYTSIGNAMAARSDENASAFQGAGVYVPDINHIANDIEQEELEVKEKKEAKKLAGKKKKKGDDAEEVAGSQDEEQQDAPSKEDSWFDESYVLRQSRAAQTATSKLKEVLSKTMREGISALQEAITVDQNSEGLERLAADKEQNVLKYRLSFLVAALGYNPPQDWMLELVPAVAGGISRVAALIQDADGQRPPCDQYADIVALGPMTDDMMSKFAQLERSARCKEDVLKLTKLFKSKREPLVKLKAAVAKATKDVLNAKGCKKRVAAQGQASTPASATSVEPSPKKQKIGKLKRPVFEACKSCTPIHSCQIEDSIPFDDYPDALKEINFDKPFILTNVACLSDLMRQETVTNALDGLKKIWPTSPLRKNPGRAGQAVLEPASDLVVATLMHCAGSDWVPPVGMEPLKDALAPTMFAIAAGRESVFLEKAGLANLRMAVSGERDVVLCPLKQLHSYLTASPDSTLKDESANPVDVPHACHSFLHASHNQVLDLKDSIEWAHLGPGDVLYTPAGWVTCEHAVGGAACDVHFLQAKTCHTA